LSTSRSPFSTPSAFASKTDFKDFFFIFFKLKEFWTCNWERKEMKSVDSLDNIQWISWPKTKTNFWNEKYFHLCSLFLCLSKQDLVKFNFVFDLFDWDLRDVKLKWLTSNYKTRCLLLGRQGSWKTCVSHSRWKIIERRTRRRKNKKLDFLPSL
jgi:hypothetical protein